MQSTERQVERVTLALRQMILAGEFGPGARIAEIPLAERLGVSRTPVRMALAVLEREGLLRSAPRRGFVVREITLDEITDAFTVRGALEALACRLALERGLSADTLATLDACLAEGERMLSKGRFTADDTGRWSAMNARFHAAILQAAGNTPLAGALENVSRIPLVGAGAIAFNSLSLDVSFRYMQAAQAEHRDVVDALRTRQSARAQALIEEHAYRSGRNLRMSLEQVRRGGASVPGLRLVVG